MKDSVILEMLEESGRVLNRMEFFEPCKHIVPTYNALLLAARENHPEEPFLQALPTVEPGGGEDSVNPRTLALLCGQLRIALASLQTEAPREEARVQEAPPAEPPREESRVREAPPAEPPGGQPGEAA